MKDYYYKFPDENTAAIELSEFYKDNKWSYGSFKHCLYVLGNVYKWIDDDTFTDTGWHLNLRLFNNSEQPPAQQYLINPTTPNVRWL